MKRIPLSRSVAAAAMLLQAPLFSQTVVERTETAAGASVSGTITQYGNERMLIRSGPGQDEVTYTYSGDTVYVDETGAPIAVTKIVKGLPVTLHYIDSEPLPIVRKVVVKAKGLPPGEINRTTTTTTTTTNTIGTISEFTPERMVVRTETAENPVRYRFTKTTTYVDESGAPVPVKLVKSGLPVTVHYTKSGDDLIATKVVVRKSVAPVEQTTGTTKTTTVSGTVTDFSPARRIVLRTESVPDPVPYTFSKTTTYVDEAGNPVSAELLKAGLPVTLHYTTVNDAPVVDRVVIRKTTTTVK